MLTVGDIDNSLFVKFPLATKEKYVGYANEEIRDMAKAEGADPDSIKEPYHYRLERYAINYALNLFGQDHIGSNKGSGFDVYKDLFLRTRLVKQESRSAITKVMFTGEAETVENRAVTSAKLIRS